MAIVRRLEATIAKIIEHAPGVRTYEMTLEGKVPRFRPGQFLHLAQDPYDPTRDWPESRVFSIASSPVRRDMVRVTISAKGRFTNRIVDELEIGSRAWIKLPYGDFTFDNSPVALIAGGTGIAPFISFLENSLDIMSDQPVRLYHGIRSPQHAMYDDVMEKCRQRLPSFESVVYVENGANGDARPGILDIAQIHRETIAMAPTYYLSGPWAMIDVFRKSLQELGVEPGNIRIDEWE